MTTTAFGLPQEATIFETATLICYWISVVLCFLLGMLTIIANGFVFYISNKKDDIGGETVEKDGTEEKGEQGKTGRTGKG